MHRSHQISAPIIRFVLLDLAGQKRQVNAVSKRFAALGALTKGE
ncbi:MAG: strawberry notch C-terminal domain-containing protein [Planctomycetes bacterium]|nr:strawberry notch C-terminal domain-containing protein [Planctomycetota bacterium]